MSSLISQYQEFLQLHQMRKTYGDYMSRFLRFIEAKNYDIKNLTSEIFTEFLKENQHFKTETINLYIKALKHFYRRFLGIKSEFIFEQLKQSKADIKIPDILTEAELNKALNYMITEDAVRNFTPMKIKALGYFLFYTGLRPMEIINFKREDFDIEKQRLVVRTPNKGKKERIVICISQLTEVLQKYFVTELQKTNAFNISKFQLENFVRKINKYLKGKKLTPHCLRHSAGRFLYQKGVDLNTIKDQLGHQSIQTTIRYTNLNIDEQERVIREKLEKHNKPKEEQV